MLTDRASELFHKDRMHHKDTSTCTTNMLETKEEIERNNREKENVVEPNENFITKKYNN